MKTKSIAIGAAAVAAASFTAGFVVAPEHQIDGELRQEGAFRVDVSQVISTTVTSLKAQNKLQVYQFTGESRVSLRRSRLAGLLKGSQEMIVPASVTYHVDLAKLGIENVQYNAEAKVVFVDLPPLTMGDVAFAPEKARTINGGLLTFDDDQVEAMRKLNFAAARKAFVRLAQSPAIVDNAKRQAAQNVKYYFEIPLRIVGHPDVKVVARFGKNAT